MLRVGIIGAGYWSEKHFKAWAKAADAKVAAVCDRDVGKAAAMAAAYGVPLDQAYGDAEEMLIRADIDCVDIVTRPDSHLPLVEIAARAGKHILCQKPFAPTLEEAERMAAAAERQRVRLMVAENWRWLTPYQAVGRILQEGTLGKLHTARYSHYDYLTPTMTPERESELEQPYMRHMPRLMFYEMGSHWLDLWRCLFGTPETLYADIRRISPHVAGEDSGVVVMGHGRFAGIMEMSWASRQFAAAEAKSPEEIDHESLVIEGELASLFMETAGQIRVIDHDGRLLYEQPLTGLTSREHELSFERLIAHFADGVRTGGAFATEARDHLDTLRLLFAIYESAAKRRPVTIGQ